MSAWHLTGISAGVVLAFTLAGCGSDPGRPKLGQVNGKVTYKGKPVTSGEVIFTPATGKGNETGHVATGKIASDGSYSLGTFDPGDGAVLGEHVVTVQVLDQKAEDMGKMKPDGTFDYVLPKSVVPQKYASVGTSPLRCKVEESGTRFDIDMKD